MAVFRLLGQLEDRQAESQYANACMSLQSVLLLALHVSASFLQHCMAKEIPEPTNVEN